MGARKKEKMALKRDKTHLFGFKKSNPPCRGNLKHIPLNSYIISILQKLKKYDLRLIFFCIYLTNSVLELWSCKEHADKLSIRFETLWLSIGTEPNQYFQVVAQTTCILGTA